MIGGSKHQPRAENSEQRCPKGRHEDFATVGDNATGDSPQSIITLNESSGPILSFPILSAKNESNNFTKFARDCEDRVKFEALKLGCREFNNKIHSNEFERDNRSLNW